MQPLVSILIPAFNAQTWIGETLRSATLQRWPRKEVIVVDDGSSDRTVEIARTFECAWVKVVTQENQGAAAARNHAARWSQGEYIQWLDADDILGADKIEQQIRAIQRGLSRRILLSGAWTRFRYRFHRAQFVADDLWCDLTPAEFLLRKIGQNLFMPNAAWLVPRELMSAAGGWDPRQSVDDDGEYFCRVVMASEGIHFVPEAKMYYRDTAGNSLSRISRSDHKLDAQWRTMQLHIQHLVSLEDSDRSRQACLKFLQLNLNYFYPERPDIVSEAERVAERLGGRLQPPRLSWKYAWIASLMGWETARQTQAVLRKMRGSISTLWDRTLAEIDPPEVSGLRAGESAAACASSVRKV